MGKTVVVTAESETVYHATIELLYDAEPSLRNMEVGSYEFNKTVRQMWYADNNHLFDVVGENPGEPEISVTNES